MTTTGWLVIAGIVLTIAYCGLIWLWRVFADWGIRREAGRTFVDAYVPECADVAPADRQTDALLSAVREAAALDAAERVVAEEEMVADLESAIEHLDRLWKAAS